MKKLYSILTLAAIAMTASAANFQLTVRGNVVNDGDRINIAEYVSPIWGGVEYNPELVLIPAVSGQCTAVCDFFKNNTTPPVRDNEYDEFDYGAEVKIRFCSFDGQCFTVPGGGSKTKTANVTAGTNVNMETELAVTVGMLDELENITIDSEFSMEITLGGETQKVYFYVNSSEGSVEGLSADNAPAAYYDLQGRSIANPTTGIYIKRQAGKATKVIF